MPGARVFVCASVEAPVRKRVKQLSDCVPGARAAYHCCLPNTL